MNKDFSEYLGKNIDEIQKDSIFLYFFSDSIMKQIGRDYYLSNNKKGIGFVFDVNLYLIAIHLHDGSDYSYSPFVDELPFGLSFSDNKENVQKKVSSSEFECGGGEVLPIFGSSKLWIKYKFSNYYLHIEFHNNEESISMITLEVM